MQFFNLSPDNVNVASLTTLAEEGFQKERLFLLQANGFKYEDSVVTQGICY